MEVDNKNKDYSKDFEDTMHVINTIANGYGFENGKEWAKEAQKRGVISWEQYNKFENVHKLRNNFSHGHAKDINVSHETYQLVKEFENYIRRSPIRGNQYDVNNNGKKNNRRNNNDRNDNHVKNSSQNNNRRNDIDHNNNSKKNNVRNDNVGFGKKNVTYEDYLDYYDTMYGINRPKKNKN